MEQLLVSMNTSLLNIQQYMEGISYGMNTIIQMLDVIVNKIQSSEETKTEESLSGSTVVGQLVENADKIKDIPFSDINDLVKTLSEVDTVKIEQTGESLAKAINTISEPLMNKDMEKLKQDSMSFSDIAKMVFITTTTTVIPTILSIVALSFLNPDVEIITMAMFGIIGLIVSMMAKTLIQLYEAGMGPLDMIKYIPFFTLVPPAIAGGMALTIPIFSLMAGPFVLPPMDWVFGSALAIVSYALAMTPLILASAPFTSTFGDWLGMSIALPLLITGIATGLLTSMYIFSMLPQEEPVLPTMETVFGIASSMFMFTIGVLPLLVISAMLTGLINVKGGGISLGKIGKDSFMDVIKTAFMVSGTFMGLILAVSSGIVLTSHILSLFNTEIGMLDINMVSNLGMAIGSFIEHTWHIATFSVILGLASGTIGAFTGGSMGFIFSILSVFTSALGFVAMISAIAGAIVISANILSYVPVFEMPFNLIMKTGEAIGLYASALEPFMPVIMAMGIGAGAVSVVPGVGAVMGFIFAILSALGVGLGILATVIGIASGIVISIYILKKLPDEETMAGMLGSVSMAGELIGTFLGKIGGALIKSSIDDVKYTLLSLNEVITKLDIEAWSKVGEGLYNLAMGLKTLAGSQLPSLGQSIGAGIRATISATVGFFEGLFSEEKTVGEAVSERLDQQFLSPIEKVDKVVKQWDIEKTNAVAQSVVTVGKILSEFKISQDFYAFSQTLQNINEISKSDNLTLFISKIATLINTINDIESDSMSVFKQTIEQLKDIINQPIEQIERGIGTLINKISQLAKMMENIEGSKLDIEFGEETKSILFNIVSILEEQSEILITLKKRI